MIAEVGQQALISIISHLIFIAIAWWALQALHFEKLLKANHVVQARILYILLSIIIGTAVSNFFLEYLLWSNQLPYIFQLSVHL
ncbi:DUF1146 family protein [Bacillaceae bacterium Marseille-Q3522]|nr:DUF1146 family protein [Bacillaceae bacterium Marseille-Q3522]